MVWEQSIDVIAMVTNEVCRCVMWPRSSWCVRQIEGGKLKAHRYWPSSFNQYVRLTLLCAHCSPTAPKEQHGALHVTLTSERAHLAYIKRTFQLKEVQTGLVCASPCAPLPSHLTHPHPQTRDIVHYCYTAWPDHGVPETTEEILLFRLRSIRLVCICVLSVVQGGHPSVGCAGRQAACALQRWCRTHGHIPGH